MKTEKRFDKAAYDREYQAKHKDRMTILADKGTKGRWKAAAKQEGKSLNRFIIDIVESYTIEHGKED